MEGKSGNGDNHLLQLETPTQKRSRMISLYIVHCAMLVFTLGFSIILTGILPYLKRLTNLDDAHLLDLFGWMVAINPIGQMVFSPIYGWITNKTGSIRLVCLISCVIYIIGNVIYSCLSLLPDTNDGWYRAGFMLLGRLLVGISTANQAPIRAYIAGATFKHERNAHISILSLFQTIGFMVGPAIQSALTPVGCSQDYNPGELKLDMYTISGWLSAGVGVISFILFLPGVFQEKYVAQMEAKFLKEEAGSDGQDILDVKPDFVAVAACIFAFFMYLFNFILLETIGTPLCMQQLGWDESLSIRNLGILMTIGAVVSLFSFGLVAPLTNRFDERLVYLILGLIPMLAGRIAMIPMGSDYPLLLLRRLEPNSTSTMVSDITYREDVFNYHGIRNTHCDDEAGQGGCALPWCEYTPALTLFQFYLGYAISAVSYPFCMAICQGIFSKVIGPRPQGLWMGLLTAVGSLARIVSPIFVSEIYKEFGTYWTFGLCAGSIGLASLVTLATYRRLVPLEKRLERLRPTSRL